MKINDEIHDERCTLIHTTKQGSTNKSLNSKARDSRFDSRSPAADLSELIYKDEYQLSSNPKYNS